MEKDRNSIFFICKFTAQYKNQMIWRSREDQ